MIRGIKIFTVLVALLMMANCASQSGNIKKGTTYTEPHGTFSFTAFEAVKMSSGNIGTASEPVWQEVWQAGVQDDCLYVYRVNVPTKALREFERSHKTALDSILRGYMSNFMTVQSLKREFSSYQKCPALKFSFEGNRSDGLTLLSKGVVFAKDSYVYTVVSVQENHSDTKYSLNSLASFYFRK